MEEAVIIDEGGNPVVLKPEEVLAEAREVLESRPSHTSIALAYWSQLRQVVLVLDMHQQSPKAPEVAEMARLIRLVKQTRNATSP